MVRIVLVEDHDLFRLGIRMGIQSHCPDIQIVGEAETGADFFALIQEQTPDIVLLDILLPDMPGADVARRLKRERPEMKILALSAENSLGTVEEMLDIGIDGFISKRMSNPQTLANAIRSVMRGDKFFGRDITEIVYAIYVSKKKTADADNEFTDREREIIMLCHEGLSSKRIAEKLFISSRTVDNHKSAIFRKLGINNTLEMVQYALKNGIIRME